ncbi:MAG TPA: class I SAM-dependent methyltransferase [Allosphingosinicella sp.]|jgi:SAM-dependent methyltransferase
MTEIGIAPKVARIYPEIAAGGFSHVDGTIGFYQRINALIGPDMEVLDFGAGRGEQLVEDPVPYRAALCRLQGKVRRLVGVDIDPAVLRNPFLDEAHVIDPSRPLPFADGQFDLIYADWVLEHVATPDGFAAEVRRLLKPGGWFCARTPNRWGVTGLGANLIPNRLHTKLLKTLQPGRQEQDVFPTTYKMNTRSAVRRYFPEREWEHSTYISNSEPPYVQRSLLLMRLVQLFWRASPPGFHTTLNVFLRKRA